jgi:hypothetical protein
MIDWHGAVLNYCQKAYGKKRGEMIQQKLWSIEHDIFFPMRAFTVLGWYKTEPIQKLSQHNKKSLLKEMHKGDEYLDNIIKAATELKKELNIEIKKLQER